MQLSLRQPRRDTGFPDNIGVQGERNRATAGPGGLQCGLKGLKRGGGLAADKWANAGNTMVAGWFLPQW